MGSIICISQFLQLVCYHKNNIFSKVFCKSSYVYGKAIKDIDVGVA